MDIHWLIGTTEARINHFLKSNHIQIPEGLQQSVFKIELPLPELTSVQSHCYCHLYPKRILLNQQNIEADVTININLDALIGLAKGEKLASLLLEKKIQMNGDIGKAHALQHWLENLGLTKEDAFAEIFGDTLANLLSSIEQQAQPFIHSALELGKNIFEQFTNKVSPTDSSDDSSALKQQIIKLREQTERLDARVQSLSAELKEHKG